VRPEQEGPAESPQEGGAPRYELRAAGVPPQLEERGAQPKGTKMLRAPIL